MGKLARSSVNPRKDGGRTGWLCQEALLVVSNMSGGRWDLIGQWQCDIAMSQKKKKKKYRGTYLRYIGYFVSKVSVDSSVVKLIVAAFEVRTQLIPDHR